MGPDSYTPRSLPWHKVVRGVSPCPHVIPKHGDSLATRSQPPMAYLGLLGPPGLGEDGKRRKLGGRGFPQVLPSKRWGLGGHARKRGSGPKGAKPRQIEVPPPPQARAHRG